MFLDRHIALSRYVLLEAVMTKVIVVYDSITGNTETMAKAVVEGAKNVKNIEVEMLKVGTRFPMGILTGADAIVVGSPTEYGNATMQMRGFLESMVELIQAKKLNLKGTPAGVFGSYGWDGGWVTEMLAKKMKTAGLRLIPPVVSAPEKLAIGSRNGLHLDECRKLGKAVALKAAKT
jgi:flavorubredoxin